ncbi:MAG: NADPH-dependent glutamate synthase [Candidatus Brocadiia bacterium]
MAVSKTPRQDMPEQAPLERIHNFNEVPHGYSPETAILEANRCLQCKAAPCRKGCPVEVRIPEFLKLIATEKFAEAARLIKSTNSLPAICGRVCPQESQCEKFCVMGKISQPVAVGRLERFAADWERNNKLIEIPKLATPTGKRIAVVGSGPAGLTIAGDMAILGHKVTIFEGLHKPGGVCVYGIPEFRLPKAIVGAEVDYLRAMGVEVIPNMIIGKTMTVDDLFDEEGFDSVFVGTGAGLPTFMGIPGENYNGVYSANEYLTRVNLMKAYLFPEYETPVKRGKRVAVFGGGNVAMDSVRTSLRLGADKGMIIYRRSKSEIPARQEEIHHAEQEGVDFMLLNNPIRILGNSQNWVEGVECMKMELGEPDASGRRRPMPIAGSEFVVPCDVVVVAIGNGPNPLVPATTPGMEVNRHGNITADLATGRTTKRGVYAGGDIVTGAATVIAAMGAGKAAGKDMHQFLMGGSW